MLAQRVWKLVDRRAVFGPGDRVVVGVSGGPDSLALLALLREQLGPRLGLQLHVAHFDHGWRPESGEDARWVADVAQGWGLPVTIGHAPSDLAETEAAAREARYAFLRLTARAIESPVIALGHTLDDQAETLMLHLLRGSGAQGLAAMRPRDGDLARPLLTTSRQEVEAFLRERHLEPLRDMTNDDPRFRRNRLRQTVMRALDDFDPAARRALARAADILAEEDACLDHEAAVLDEQGAPIVKLPIAIQRRILVHRHPGVSFSEIEAMREGGEPTVPPIPPSWQLIAHPCACDPLTFRARDPIGHVDLETLALPLTVQTRRPGDRVQPLGQMQSKRLQDLFVDAHVPRHLRDHMPIVRDQRGIVWIPGVTVSHPHRVRPDTPQPYHLELRPQLDSNTPVTDS